MKFLIIASIVFGLIIGLWLIGRMTFAFQFFRVSSTSNQPTLKTGGFLFSSNWKKPQRFDFICYRVVTPETGPTVFIHRLCGLPGDIVEIRAGILYVNKQNADNDLTLMHVYKIHVKDTSSVSYDPLFAYTIPQYPDTVYVPLDDKYVRTSNIPCKRYVLPPGLRDESIFSIYRKNWNQDNFGPMKVPANKFFVLGDNRENAMDSRYQGMIERSKYLATVLWK